jgi:hypothetical protein
MIAALTLAPATSDILACLQAVADALVAANTAWLRTQLRRGARPPLHLLSAEPPFAPRPVVYVPHHGAPVDDVRVYQDGPTAMRTGRATCIDVACYDAPASTLLLGVPRSVAVRPWVSTQRSGPLNCHAWLMSPTGELFDSLADYTKEGA